MEQPLGTTAVTLLLQKYCQTSVRKVVFWKYCPVYKWYLGTSRELVIFWVKTSPSPAHWACSADWKGLFTGPNLCAIDKEDLPFGLSYQQARDRRDSGSLSLCAGSLLLTLVKMRKENHLFFSAMRKCFSSYNFDYSEKTDLKWKAGVFWCKVIICS